MKQRDDDARHDHAADAVPGPRDDPRPPERKIVPPGHADHLDLTVAESPTPRAPPVDPPSRIMPLIVIGPHDAIVRHVGGAHNLVLGGVYGLRLVGISQPGAPHGNVRLEFALALLDVPPPQDPIGIRIVPE